MSTWHLGPHITGIFREYLYLDRIFSFGDLFYLKKEWKHTFLEQIGANDEKWIICRNVARKRSWTGCKRYKPLLKADFHPKTDSHLWKMQKIK